MEQRAGIVMAPDPKQLEFGTLSLPAPSTLDSASISHLILSRPRSATLGLFLEWMLNTTLG
jgi:hypothetical protein